MKIKVISGFVTHKGETKSIGDVITDIDNKNAERLCKAGCCEIVADVDETELHEETKDLAEMKKAELIEYAASIGVEIDGKMTKADIIKTITDADTLNTEFPE